MKALVFRNGSGWTLLPGAFAMVFGGTFVWAAFFGGVRPTDIGGWVVIGLFGAAGLCVLVFGARLAFLRSNVTIDCQRRCVNFSWRFLFPIKTARYMLGEFSEIVVVEKTIPRPFGAKGIHWVVALTGKTREIQIDVTDRDDAFSVMSEVSRSTGLPTNAEVRRSP